MNRGMKSINLLIQEKKKKTDKGGVHQQIYLSLSINNII